MEHSFSFETKVNLQLPKDWGEMNDGMWIYVCRCLAAGFQPQEVAEHFVVRALGKMAKLIPEMQIVVAAECMDFIAKSPKFPCRPEKVDGVRAVDAEFHEVEFAKYLAAENYYQAAISEEGNEEAMDGLVSVMYPGYNENYPVEKDTGNRNAIRYISIMWYTAVKSMFSEIFYHLFKPVKNEEETDMRKVMTMQIHVLSGGDITKEKDILEADVWSALTELDTKIEEAEQIKKIK